jgi:ABC-type Na+ transport system ATPase subunit NatA
VPPDTDETVMLRGVRKRYTRRGAWVLDGVDLDLAPGTVTALVGGNGSGKSTLLRIVAALTRPTAGSVRRPTSTGYVPEHQPDAVRLTAADYLGYLGAVRGMDVASVRSASASLLTRLHLEPGPGAGFEDLSKGNRQKVMVSQALLRPVSLLVLDEPLSGLDPDARRTVGELVAEARAAGSAVIVSGHTADDPIAADRVLRVMDGLLHEEPALRPSTPDRVSPPVPVSSVPAAPPPVAVAVTLRDPGGGLDASFMVAHHGRGGGAGSARRDPPALGDAGTVLQVHVAPDDVDAFLADAIAAGWSVLHVEVVAPGEDDVPR